ncbi:DUF805 domain-containing protein [Pontiella desulfatans]|uniref:DUF805 domain-containing protein n=1 Tax=Pontiella desulfatans TaxID=2750659 RepID=UPI00109C8E60|nr:DUF805 domain-containing protein [Pontiella desulfatans]
MTATQFLFSIKGRVSRKQYWLYFVLPISIPWVSLSTFLAMNYPEESLTFRLLCMPIIYWIAICAMGKRWHDRNKSAWWILILLIPIIGGLWFLVEGGFLKGTDGSNRFGDDPTQ